MKKILLLFLIAGALGAYGQSKSYDYAYMNGKGICVYSAADKLESLIDKKGQDPFISPDGKKLAYTTFNDNGDRFIEIVDLGTKNKLTLNTQSNNCYGPVWSPDGTYIAYNVFNTQTSKWSIAIIDHTNSDPQILTGQLDEAYSPTWASDSKSITVQNMDNVYVIGLSGNIISTYKVADITKTLGPSSSDRFIFTNDNKKIVFSSAVDEPGAKDGPPTAVFIYNTEDKSTLRLSPKGYWANDVAIKDNKVLFTASKVKSMVQNIYIIDMDGSNFKVLFPNCASVSVKR